MSIIKELGRFVTARYFSFGRPSVPRGARAMSDTPQPPPTFPLLAIGWQYLGVLLGIFAQPIIVQRKKGGPSDIRFDFASIGYLVASIVVAIVIFPGIYRPMPPATHPRFVQFCILFGAGIGWQAIFDSVVK